jgi:hypothetical protein
MMELLAIGLGFLCFLILQDQPEEGAGQGYTCTKVGGLLVGGRGWGGGLACSSSITVCEHLG